MIDVAVVGAAGYTGRELLKILFKHPDVNLTCITSNTYSNYGLAEVFPEFANKKPLIFESHNPEAIAEKCDAVFLCLPHKESMSIIQSFLKNGKTVFDLSADFRLKDPDIYTEWYKVEHIAAELLGKAVYGLTELYRGEIKNAKVVAIPGCYPTSIILGLAPVISQKWFDRTSIVVNTVSGSSGLGRKPDSRYSLSELDGNFYAYGAPLHRHTPEIEQELSKLTDSEDVKLLFIPHLLPVARGIYTTITTKLHKKIDSEELTGIYKSYFHDSKFITVCNGFPEMQWAVGTNQVFIGAHSDPRTGTLIITSTIDNLIKGAGGQAVQCLNVRYGFEETKGLI